MYFSAAVEGELGLLEVPEVSESICCVILCMLEAVEGELCLLEVLKVPELVRCVLLCMLEGVVCRL